MGFICNHCGWQGYALDAHLCFAHAGTLSSYTGHPLACGIWCDAVCTCEPTRPAVAAGCKHDPPCGVEDCEFAEVGEERHDTEPAQPSEPTGKRCYFCGESARTVVYCAGIPSCLQCAERAASKRRSAYR